MARDLKEDFFRLDGAWASFELGSIRRRDDYLRPFRVLRCKIDDQADFQAADSARSNTEATVMIEIFGDEELVVASGSGPVHAIDNAMRNILEKHYPELSEVSLEQFDVRLMHALLRDDDEGGAGALVRVLAIQTTTKDGERLGLPPISSKPVSNASSTVWNGISAASTNTNRQQS